MKTAFVIEAKKEITIAAFEGRISKDDARNQLAGILALIAVANKESKSEKLKNDLAEVAAGIEATITNLV